MVKQQEKKQKRNPLIPLFGGIIAIGLVVVAYVLANVLIDNVQQLKQFKDNTTGVVAITVGLWFVLLALAFFVVSLAVGKDPETQKYRQPLPRRNVKKK